LAETEAAAGNVPPLREHPDLSHDEDGQQASRDPEAPADGAIAEQEDQPRHQLNPRQNRGKGQRRRDAENVVVNHVRGEQVWVDDLGRGTRKEHASD
jgi:hypothetical protein